MTIHVFAAGTTSANIHIYRHTSTWHPPGAPISLFILATLSGMLDSFSHQWAPKTWVCHNSKNWYSDVDIPGFRFLYASFRPWIKIQSCWGAVEGNLGSMHPPLKSKYRHLSAGTVEGHRYPRVGFLSVIFRGSGMSASCLER